MKQKLLNLIGICCIVLSGCFTYNVEAEGVANNDGDNKYHKVDCEVDGCLDTEFQGIRITIVDDKGNRIAGTRSVDYLAANSNDKPGIIWGRNYSNVYANLGEYNYKKEIVDNREINWTKLDSINYPKLSFQKFMYGYVESNNYFETYFKNISDVELTSIFNKAFGRTFSHYTEALNNISSDVCIDISNGYFVIEPLTGFYIPYKGTYIGTYSDIMTISEVGNLYSFQGSVSKYNFPFSITVGYDSIEQVERLNFIKQLGFIPVENSLSAWENNGKSYATAGYVGDSRKRYLSKVSDAFYRVIENGTKMYLGVGVGAFGITDKVKKACRTCYSASYSCTKTACEETTDKNKRICSTNIGSAECVNQDDYMTVHESGEKTIELIEGKCSLYCKESSEVSYPGNVSSAVKLGENLEWLTKGDDSKYPLTTTSTLSCKIEMNDNSALTQDCIDKAATKDYSYRMGNTNATLKYQAPIQNSGVYSKSTYYSITLNQKCNSDISVDGTSVTISNNCSYTLPENKNIAIDKKTLDFIDNIKETSATGITNYIIMKNGGVIPIEGYDWYDSKIISSTLFNDKYELVISNLPLGYNGKYTNVLDDPKVDSDDYVCKYSITTDINGACKCPPGTINSGYDLTTKLEETPKTCAEAIEVNCNDENLVACPEDSLMPGYKYQEDEKYKQCIKNNNELYCMKLVCYNSSLDVCPEDSSMPGYKYQEDESYKACLSGGGTKTECMKLICNPECGTNCEYKCPPNGTDDKPITDYPGKDITTCVYKERGAGKTLVDALNSCYKSECYIGFGNKKIIYRTISLENPFPSKDADQNTSQEGLSALNYGSLDTTKKTFNQTIKGRYPGTNWNGVQLVYNKILNNRGYTGSKIYNEATPLYVIELDAKSIKEIREYNKEKNKTSDGYADFTLECTDGAYCRSTFLRSSTITGISGNSILTGGTCQRVSNKSEFISCYETATSN